jgi:LysM repeat protein
MLSAAPADAAQGSVDPLVLRAQPAPERISVPATFRPAATPSPETYTVVAGDTVSSIAARFGLRTTDVLALNGLGWKSIIRPGQVLRLSGAAVPAPVAPVAAPPVAAPPVAASGTYTIVPGDTITAIARRHGVSVQAVLDANGLSRSSIIYPGRTLTVPGATGTAAAPAPPASAAPASPAPAPAPGGTYTIKPGDTISSIAARHGVSAQAVLSANKLGWSSIIYPGQTLTIPQPVVSIPGLDAEQVANARMIVQVGRGLGVPDRGIAIALGAAMQESSMRNVGWGDRDSLGLFQQRPSAGWGTPAQVADPVRATMAFYGGASDPNGVSTRGLLDIPGWQGMTFTQAAQAVQVSAYPDAYAQWENRAVAWLAALN